MSNDELKKRILARRAKFVAAALAASGLGVAAAACGGDVTQAGDAGADAAVDSPPQPCLSPPQGDAGFDAPSSDGDADAGPQPCLVPIEDSGGGG
jgi:hypothetical protein